MENFLLPSTIEVKEGIHPNQGVIEIGPCYFGYGTTLGNALRRVLLSSLQGAAVTAIKIKGSQHEFSSIDYVQEDTLELLLNFKRLRLRLFTDEPVRLHLHAKGKGDVTGKNIEADSNVEVVNPDLVLATITDTKGELDLEIFVQKGRGYVTSEERTKSEKELGVMAMDALYTPVVNVGYKVENMRVGEITDYDKLILTIETDGTVTPKEALSQSARILIDYLSLLTDNNPSGNNNDEVEPIVEEKKKTKKSKK